MHDDDANPDLMQDADLLDQGFRRLGRHERVAARLQDEHLALEDADVRDRMPQRRDDDRALVAGESSHESYPFSIRYNTAICTTIRLRAS